MSSKFILLSNPNSPYVHKVRVAARELGLWEQIEVRDVIASPVIDSEVAQNNPAAKIPTLVFPSGEGIFGSQTIVQYLDLIAGGGKLLPPSTDARRISALTLESAADALLDAALLLRYETFARPEALRWDDWAEGQKKKIFRSLSYFADRLPSATNSAPGGRLSDPSATGVLPLQSIAAASALWYLDRRFSTDFDWRAAVSGGAALARWYEQVQARESWKAAEQPIS